MSKSKRPSKQRKEIYKGALHKSRKLLVAPLNKKLKEELNKLRLVVRKGDTVKIMVGDFKGKKGKVERVDYDKAKVFVKDIKYKDSSGQEKLRPLVASNLLIIDAVLDDNKRISIKKSK